MFESSVIVEYESLSCPRCEKMDLKIIQSLLERVKKQTLWDLKDFSRRTADSLTVQDEQGTHEQLSLNKNTAVDHSKNNTISRIKWV